MFHWQDGLYFTRDRDGGVLIQKRESAQVDAPILFSAVVDPDSWASIIASVSSRSEDPETFRAAQEFHG